VARRGGRSRSRSGYYYDAGHEAARRHIAEAEQLSTELGGMDKEVKAFFFKLSASQLDFILKRYREQYGEKPYLYAIDAFPKWRAGITHMSGLVAGRLFNLLPPIMPLDLKLRIVEGLWEQQGAKRKDYLLVPKEMESASIHRYVSENYFSYVAEQSIPNSIKDRFNWLSGEDARVAEQLFRHLRNVQLKAKEQIATVIMELVDEQAASNSDVITETVSTIEIGKHAVSIKRSKWVNMPTNVNQMLFARGNAPQPAAKSYGWFWLLLAAAVLVFFLTR
jgi:hypothetical protein